MSTYFIADLHLGHKKILNFSPMRGGTTIDEHDDWICSQWTCNVRAKDTIFVLGDVAFSREKLKLIGKLPGKKKLVLGNHDLFSIQDYLNYFEDVYGFKNKYNFWLSHAPIHSDSLRGKINIHGHLHHEKVKIDLFEDTRYMNVCVEQCNGVPISLEEIRYKARSVK